MKIGHAVTSRFAHQVLAAALVAGVPAAALSIALVPSAAQAQTKLDEAKKAHAEAQKEINLALESRVKEDFLKHLALAKKDVDAVEAAVPDAATKKAAGGFAKVEEQAKGEKLADAKTALKELLAHLNQHPAAKK